MRQLPCLYEGYKKKDPPPRPGPETSILWVRIALSHKLRSLWKKKEFWKNPSQKSPNFKKKIFFLLTIYPQIFLFFTDDYPQNFSNFSDKFFQFFFEILKILARACENFFDFFSDNFSNFFQKKIQKNFFKNFWNFCNISSKFWNFCKIASKLRNFSKIPKLYFGCASMHLWVESRIFSGFHLPTLAKRESFGKPSEKNTQSNSPHYPPGPSLSNLRRVASYSRGAPAG